MKTTLNMKRVALITGAGFAVGVLGVRAAVGDFDRSST